MNGGMEECQRRSENLRRKAAFVLLPLSLTRETFSGNRKVAETGWGIHVDTRLQVGRTVWTHGSRVRIDRSTTFTFAVYFDFLYLQIVLI